jgi:hypothetical protein
MCYLKTLKNISLFPENFAEKFYHIFKNRRKKFLITLYNFYYTDAEAR